MLKARLSGTILMSLVALGCSERRHVASDLEGRVVPIVRGEASSSAEDYVVRLEIPELGARCTGTLIDPSVVLTARHCVSHVSPGNYTCTEEGTLASDGSSGGKVVADVAPFAISIVVGDSMFGASEFRTARAIMHENASVLCGHDVALLLLDRPVRGIPMPRVRLRKTTSDEPLLAVGWGATDDGTAPTQRQRRAGLHMVGAGPSVGVAEGELLVSQGACVGDSGGPLLSADGSEVIGVVSRGPSGSSTSVAGACLERGTENVYSEVRHHRALIWDALARARLGYGLEDGGHDAQIRSAVDGGAEMEQRRPSSGCGAGPGDLQSAAWVFLIASLPRLRGRRGTRRPPPER